MTGGAPQAGPEFVVLTGFLGSGKTTLLRDFIVGPEAADTAVIVNEVGEIGLDGAILREAGGQIAPTLLASGCICCQIGGDLAPTVEALLALDRPAGAPPLGRIVLETSGISKPGPILRQLAALASHRMRVSVVATFDPTQGPRLRDVGEAAAQWAGAHRLVVTKADLAGEVRFRAAAEEAAAINALAEIVAEPDRAIAVRRAFAPPTGAMPRTLPSLASGPPHPGLATLLLRQGGAVAYDDLAVWLDNLAGALGERLLRLKGLVAIREDPRPILVESVGTLFSTPRPFRGEAPSAGSFLILIGRDLKPDELGAITPRLPFRATAPRRSRLSAETV